MDIPATARIFIIEGIAGSGKDTLQQQLREKLGGKLVYSFSEDELLFSWKHAWIPGIQKLRLRYLNQILDYCEQTLKENPDAVFILNRFHISLITTNTDLKKPAGYRKLIERLRALPIHIYFAVVDKEKIEERVAHKERKDPLWEWHKQKRLQSRGYATLGELYSAEQKLILKMLKAQKIPYSVVNVQALF
jgi:deoxyadenosine/deoxycytidine kinase